MCLLFPPFKCEASSNISQEMEQERIARENEEKERGERMKKIKEQFADPNSQWEKDKSDIQNMALEDDKEKAKNPVADSEGGKAPGSKSPEAAAPAGEKGSQEKVAVSLSPGRLFLSLPTNVFIGQTSSIDDIDLSPVAFFERDGC
jgi:hypothetical protein